MAIKYEKIQPGMVLYDRHRHGVGNTTMTALGEWKVYVRSLVSADAQNPRGAGAMVSWNGNPEQFWPRKRLEKLYSWSMYDSTECRVVHRRPVRLSKSEREAAKAARSERNGG